ncbi:MAG: hypothetical protein AAFV43_09905 [Planctomycetota bacterium]
MALTIARAAVWALLVCLLLSWSPTDAGATGGVRTVALTGMPMPGTDDVFGDVGNFGFSLNNHGEVAFVATPTQYEYGLGTPNFETLLDTAVFTEAGGQGLRRINHESVINPYGERLRRVDRPIITDIGVTYFNGQPNPSPIAGFSRYFDSYGESVSQGVVAVGERVPYNSFAMPEDEWYSGVKITSVTSSGGYLLRTTLWSEYSDLAAGDFRPGNFRSGIGLQPSVGRITCLTGLPEIDAQEVVDWFALDIARDASFVIGLETISNDVDLDRLFGQPIDTDSFVLRSNAGGDLEVLARDGSTLIPGERAIAHIEQVATSETGFVAVAGVLEGGGSAIWRFSPDRSIERVAETGAPFVDWATQPYSDNGIFRSLVVGGEGTIAYQTVDEVSGDQRFDLWVAPPDQEARLVAEPGDRLAGSETEISAVSSYSVNARGQVAFSVSTVSDQPTDAVIWAEDQDGIFTPLAVAGGMLNVSDDATRPDWREVERVSGVGNHNFNDRGQIAFQAWFTDGTSGVFVSDVIAIPEPAGFWLSLIAVGACRRERQR